METKWYSDFWRLFASPFKGGIDQVVQSGTLKKGFWGTVFLWAIYWFNLFTRYRCQLYVYLCMAYLYRLVLCDGCHRFLCI